MQYTRTDAFAGLSTASMDVGSIHDGKGTPHIANAGLVLLYAPSYERYAPAYLLEERDLMIGRDARADICIPEPSVSRQHVRVYSRDGRYVLTDLGGRNGTIVNGRFANEVVLEHLDEIRVGDAIFKFVSAGVEEYARFRIDGTTIGEKPAWREHAREISGGYQIDLILRAVHRVAQSGISVVLLGESGTGKEVFARYIHASSGRIGAFQAINCAAIPDALLESELFGYKRGAFSGAARDKQGLIQAANGGTLLLDEIGDMPLEAQAKLLRVLQSKEVIPLGASSPERVDVRIVCATHRDIVALQRNGRFRGDLYARLNEFRIILPPLRERKEDIFALFRALLARHNRRTLNVSFSFMAALLHYDFPFNVRELEAFIKRAAALAEGNVLDVQQLPEEVTELMKDYGKKGFLINTDAQPCEVPTEAALRALLGQEKGNIASVSRHLGKDRTQIRRWIQRYGIDISEYRGV